MAGFSSTIGSGKSISKTFACRVENGAVITLSADCTACVSGAGVSASVSCGTPPAEQPATSAPVSVPSGTYEFTLTANNCNGPGNVSFGGVESCEDITPEESSSYVEKRRFYLGSPWTTTTANGYYILANRVYTAYTVRVIKFFYWNTVYQNFSVETRTVTVDADGNKTYTEWTKHAEPETSVIHEYESSRTEERRIPTTKPTTGSQDDDDDDDDDDDPSGGGGGVSGGGSSDNDDDDEEEDDDKLRPLPIVGGGGGGGDGSGDEEEEEEIPEDELDWQIDSYLVYISAYSLDCGESFYPPFTVTSGGYIGVFPCKDDGKTYTGTVYFTINVKEIAEYTFPNTNPPRKITLDRHRSLGIGTSHLPRNTGTKIQYIDVPVNHNGLVFSKTFALFPGLPDDDDSDGDGSGGETGGDGSGGTDDDDTSSSFTDPDGNTTTTHPDGSTTVTPGEKPRALSFEATAYSAPQSGGSFVLPILRLNVSNDSITVEFKDEQNKPVSAATLARIDSVSSTQSKIFLTLLPQRRFSSRKIFVCASTSESETAFAFCTLTQAGVPHSARIEKP